ncbi:MAG: hypothetical protein IKA51_02620 [Clostridia bacterium]|nr:hypothetical protein [Clostridia bacterium]
MKKRSIAILLISAIIFSLIAVALVFVINNYIQIPNFKPTENPAINYNNYVTGNSVDYRNGKFVWRGSTFLRVGTVVDTDGNIQKIYGVGDRIQLLDGGTAFLNQNTLVINKKTKERVAENVDSFTVTENGILYARISDSYKKTLYWYDLATSTAKVVAENVAAYCVDEQKIFVLDDSGQVTLYSETAVEKKIKIDIQSYPVTLMIQNNCLLYKSLNQLCLLDPDTGDIRDIVLSESKYINNRITYICDKDRIVYSFQATRTNGSFVADIDSPDNGVWIVDPVSFEKQKLCDETFYSLYLWGDVLIGENGNGLYQISIADGELTKIV